MGCRVGEAIEFEVGVVEGAEGGGAFGFVFLDVGCVDPAEGVHESGIVSGKYGTGQGKGPGITGGIPLTDCPRSD